MFGTWFFQAEAWVNNMSASATGEPNEREFEGRPSRLSLALLALKHMNFLGTFSCVIDVVSWILLKAGSGSQSHPPCNSGGFN